MERLLTKPMHPIGWTPKDILTISFQLNKLSDFSWHGRELSAEAIGILTIKGISQNISIPDVD